MACLPPTTPVRPRFTSGDIATAHDSPFSDYFTDDARSQDDKMIYTMPSTQTQNILTRLHALTAHILRSDPPSSTIDKLASGLDGLERALSLGGAGGLVDSALVMPVYEDDHERSHELHLRTYSSHLHDAYTDHATLAVADSTDDIVTSVDTADTNPHETDSDHGPVSSETQLNLLSHAQTILDRVTRANKDLTNRFTELRNLNDSLADQLESSTSAQLTLRSEIETLRAGQVYDHSELLFLKLQLKALEVEARDTFELAMEATGPADDGEGTIQDGRDAADHGTIHVRELSLSLERDLHAWKSDWEDVDARLRARRERFGITLSPTTTSGTTTGDDADVRHRTVADPASSRSPRSPREDGKDDDEPGDWVIDVCRKRRGVVDTIIVKRSAAGHGRGPAVRGWARAVPEPQSPGGEIGDTASRPRHDCSIRASYDVSLVDGHGGDDDDDESLRLSSEDSDSDSDPFVVRGRPGQVHYCGRCARALSESDNTTNDHGYNDDDEDEHTHDYDDDRARRTTPTVSAWHEFCDGLSSLAGMDR